MFYGRWTVNYLTTSKGGLYSMWKIYACHEFEAEWRRMSGWVDNDWYLQNICKTDTERPLGVRDLEDESGTLSLTKLL